MDNVHNYEFTTEIRNDIDDSCIYVNLPIPALNESYVHTRYITNLSFKYHCKINIHLHNNLTRNNEVVAFPLRPFSENYMIFHPYIYIYILIFQLLLRMSRR